ncbi:MAG: hypothetical protein ABIO04_09400 [Ferruginibacter sp.]
MKNYLYPAACLLSGLVLINSCSTSSISKSERETAYVNSKETASSTCFVKMNDGTIKTYSTLKLITGTFINPYLLADGNVKIKAGQIVSYQNANHFAVSQKTFCCGRMSHVATETLPGFAVRTVKGKLNVYCKKYYTGQSVVDEYFLQAGNDGLIKPYSPELMNQLVKDNPEAYQFFNNKKFKGRTPAKLQATALLYNGDQSITKN